MEIQTIPLGPLGANCYILSDPAAGICAVIDPGDSGQELAVRLADRGLRASAILLTHGHYDHVGGVAALHRYTGAPVYLSTADGALPPSLAGAPLPPTADCGEGTVFTVGTITVTTMATPGHSAGSVCFLARDGGQTALFTGDTLFAGSCGRTDFPGGSMEEMMDSLARLGHLPGDCPVLPGHGPASTLERERQMNPYLRQALAAESGA